MFLLQFSFNYRNLSGAILLDTKVMQLSGSFALICINLMDLFFLCYLCTSTKIESREIGCNLHHLIKYFDNIQCKMKVNQRKLNDDKNGLDVRSIRHELNKYEKDILEERLFNFSPINFLR